MFEGSHNHGGRQTVRGCVLVFVIVAAIDSIGLVGVVVVVATAMVVVGVVRIFCASVVAI